MSGQLKRINFGDLVFKFSTLSSTMDFARQLGALGYPEGTAVLAEEQVVGRGTKGRDWHSAKGLGLYVSFILRPAPTFLNLLPLTIGLAASEAIQELDQVEVHLKWPNDLVYGGKKLGGILCEAGTSGQRPVWTVAGIGINLNHHRRDFPKELAGLATSLFLITGKKYDPESLFELLGQKLRVWYNTLRKGRINPIIEQYQERLAFKPGQTLILRTQEGETRGQFQGISEKGGLKLKSGSTIRTVYASEIVKVLS